MNWSALIQERCPRCNHHLLEAGMLDTVRMCGDPHCLFKIGIDKFNKIVADEVKRSGRRPTGYDPDENLSALNNL